MQQAAAILAILIFLGLSVFQLLLVTGMPIGEFAWGGSTKCCQNRCG
ncbi:MAG: hypothetical protein TR69_WS6001000225 [candidate division WS6 bacterium OLB20]|uniref:Uncharacterized protein n=1 Tax=candidate division WS6 bacterium OLB20 TaxID=1617426 RepID=A0A136M0B7_9BACT|nr:MAG: hypothetical protein TR69_WS6001000225 [candidate division WS6 bacterium OLB20]